MTPPEAHRASHGPVGMAVLAWDSRRRPGGMVVPLATLAPKG